MDFTCNSTI